ncbi:hypothetical protein AV530_006043 [Patagioenas fasciata monilis]|uniref:Uncharacterized protein n=1 Tax=Patagioenas fasciata monilis TaxID=372326 RepID=A0A1V4J8H1_PATFA|nr:hypothetical protein AV530_006043 [Patagioenas fasciata monilis]
MLGEEKSKLQASKGGPETYLIFLRPTIWTLKRPELSVQLTGMLTRQTETISARAGGKSHLCIPAEMTHPLSP